MPRKPQRYPIGSAFQLARFWNMVTTEEASECWRWTGPFNLRGYGMFRLTIGYRRRVHVTSHRMSYMLATGEQITSEQLVCHRCDHPWCVNPAHLFLGTNLDNMADCAAKGRHRNLKKPVCPRCGEDFSPATEEMRRYGVKRVCWPCKRRTEAERARQYRAEKRRQRELAPVPLSRIVPGVVAKIRGEA